MIKPYSFDVVISGDAAQALQKAKRDLAAYGATLDGDARGGRFEAKTPLGGIHGTYRVRENILTLTVMDKPFLVSHPQIEQAVRSYFA